MPTVEQFSQMLRTQPLADVVQNVLFQGEPHVFADRPTDYRELQMHLHGALGVPSDRLTIVGSARFGFSLNPDRYGQPFSDMSDVDIVVIDEALFDEIWHIILRWYYPRRQSMGSDKDWVTQRRREIYLGYFVPNEIRFDWLSFPPALARLRDLSASWFGAFQGIGINPRLAGRQYNSRLYRTWEHATMYHESGLQEIRSRLRAATEAT